MDLVQGILELDYEAQHFGFHPRTFVDMIYNAFYENIVACLNDLKQHMIQEYKDALPPSVINLHTDSMLLDFIKLCDKSIDKLEVYIKSNVFIINPHSVLPEDKIHVTNPCTKVEDEKIDEEIKELKRRILDEKAKSYNLKKMINEQKQVKERLLRLQKELQYLLKTACEENVSKESIESLYSNLDCLICDISLKPDLFHSKGFGA